MPRRAGHTGEHAAGCAACITEAEKQRMPWHSDYLDTLARLPAIERKHNAARARQERAQAMRDLGMTKVRGGWE